MNKESDFMRTIVGAAVQAPSGGNNQPWSFHCDGEVLYVVNDRSRASSPTLDVGERATYAALGAAVENAVIAAAAAGRLARVQWLPDPNNPRIAARLDFTDGDPAALAADAALYPQVNERLTNRRTSTPRALPADQIAALRAAAELRGGQLSLCHDPKQLDVLAEILGVSDGIRMFSAALHGEMMGELRFTKKETDESRDGIDLATLELSGGQRRVIRMMRRFSVARFMGKLGAGKAFIAGAKQMLATSSAFAVVSVPGHGLADYLQGGRAMQRVWLTATSLGVVFQPLAAVTYLFMRVRFFNSEGFDPATAHTLQSLLDRFDHIFPEIGRDRGHVLYFRLGYAERASARSLRRPVDAVLHKGPPPAI